MHLFFLYCLSPEFTQLVGQKHWHQFFKLSLSQTHHILSNTALFSWSVIAIFPYFEGLVPLVAWCKS